MLKRCVVGACCMYYSGRLEASLTKPYPPMQEEAAAISLLFLDKF
jgi:hypothetical protein